MATLIMGAWLAAIAGKLAVLLFAVRRRIPAPCFILFFALHSARSVYMLLYLRGDAYRQFAAATMPYMDAAAAIVSIEALALLVWRLPRFRVAGVLLFAICALFGAMVSAAGHQAWPWPSLTAGATAAAAERTIGILLSATLAFAVLLMSHLRACDRGALHHAATLTFCTLVSSATTVIDQYFSSPNVASLVSSLGALAAYGAWLANVRHIDLTRKTPQGPLDPRQVERAWGARA